jgi:uncharacterized protein YggE
MHLSRNECCRRVFQSHFRSLHVRLSALALAFSLSCTIAPSLTGQAAAPEPPSIETVGTGQRRVAPDRAHIHIIVESKALTAAEAATRNGRAVGTVQDTLRRAGLDSGVTTSSYHVGPDFERSPEAREPRRVGYTARTVLRVRLSRLDYVGRVIDASLAKGATGVEAVYFESSRAEEERRAALAEAAAAARRDAEALARALGGSLGRLISVSTAGSTDPRRLNMAMDQVRLRGTEITPSEIVIAAAVITRWHFVAAP